MANVHKTKLRQELKLKREQVSDRDGRSELICQKLCSLEVFRDAGLVIPYFSIHTEVNPSAIVEQAFTSSKLVAAPFVRGDELALSPIQSLDQLERGAFGILEPSEQQKYKALDLDSLSSSGVVLVPGLGFTRSGYRIGYGKAYYDRFLPQLPSQIVSIGLAFEAQLIDEFDPDNHDVPVHMVLTEAGHYLC